MSSGFPMFLFALYFLFYSGQSIYNTYLNLYLSEIGLDYTQIGFIVSFSTVFLLVAQMFWAMVSDRVANKARILSLLLIVTSAICLLFYIGTSFTTMLIVVTLFSLFFNPIVPLLDNYSVELVEMKRQFDYGQLRMGGTIGYCVTVLFIGFFLKDTYRPVFYMVCVFMALAFLLSLTLPAIRGYGAHAKKNRKGLYMALLKNRSLFGLICFNLVFSMGLNFFYSFYPIYFTSIGGDSSLVGTMMFLCAVTEIPSLMLIGRIEKRFGERAVLTVAGIIAAVRWILLYSISNPMVAIFVNLLHGPGYTSFNYTIITYIGRNVPKELRATGQSLNVLISTVGSKVVFGYLGGLASSFVGPQGVMLLSSLLMVVATIVFFIWSTDKTDLKPIQIKGERK